MVFFAAAFCVFLGSGLLAYPAKRIAVGLASAIGFYGNAAASLLALYPVIRRFFFSLDPEPVAFLDSYLSCDALSAFFLLPALILAPLCGLHALNMIKERSGAFWLFYNALCACILLIPLADNELLFLVLWELMGLTSFALVLFYFHCDETRHASWFYTLSTHAGSAFLIPMFLLILQEDGVESHPVAIFLLALCGFGLKSGTAFFHFWLPHSYAAAPTPVSAFMSGAMSNLGIYGMLRIFQMIGLKEGYGWTLYLLGMAGMMGAIIFSLAQNHLKRLIAYSSVENFGIMNLGIGFSILGFFHHNEILAVLSAAGVLLHIFNHSMLKGMLFILAGSVYHATETFRLSKMGGLLKRMPFSGGAFIFGALSISGLPPFNAFLSEFLLYLAAFFGLLHPENLILFIASLLLVITLAFTGGIATAAFSKAAAFVFLGEPRSDVARHAKESTWPTLLPAGILLTLCLAIMIWAPALLRLFGKELFLPNLPERTGFDVLASLDGAARILAGIGLAGCIFCAVFALLAFFRCILPRAKVEESGPTWDCGYSRPTERMQYSSSSYSDPLEDFFRTLLHPVEHLQVPHGIFPKKSTRSSYVRDISERLVWDPLFRLMEKISLRIHEIQSGYLHVYILFMVTALLLMLLWAFFFYQTPRAEQVMAAVSEVLK